MENIYYDLYIKSISKNTRESFWFDQCKEIDWFKYPEKSKILTHKKNTPFYQWFPDSEVNICYNCVDRHIKNNHGHSLALIYESYYLNKIIKFTFNEIYVIINKIAKILLDNGVKKGDRVIIYMPMIPEGILSMLACCRIGAIHSVVFGGFAAMELGERISDCEPKFILTASCGIEPRRKIPYYPIVLEAMKIAKCLDAKILLFQRYDALFVPKEALQSNTLVYNEIEQKISNDVFVPPVPMKASDIFFILYTSGTSGIPKGVVRDYSSIVTINFTMKYIMNIHQGDVVFSTSDIGWIVGHIFIVYGPLLRGATTTIFEGKPVRTPNSGKCWEIIEKYKVKAFYSSPTALRAIKQDDPECSMLYKHDIRCLQSLHLSGERCDPETFKWIKGHLNSNGNKVIINDQWWQTETGWPICCNNAGLSPFDLPPGTAGPPLMGYKIKILEEGYIKEITQPCQEGKICIELPLPPGFMKTLYNNDKAFIERYITKDNSHYISGDIGWKTEKGFICVFGRDDDMIKVAGHRLSTGKIEEVVAKVSGVSECAVVSEKDELKGEVPFCFIVCQKEVSHKEIKEKVKDKVINDIGRICALKDVVVVEKLPKTRSGKIIRSVLKSIVNKSRIYVPPTIEDKTVVNEIMKIFAKPKL